MRAIRFVCFLLTVASAIVASAIVTSEIVASAQEAAVCTAGACRGETCPLSTATAKSTIELDIRVMEINVSKLRALSFDFAAIWGPTAPWEQIVTGYVGSGFTGFLDAIDREGLVEQDLTLAQQVVDGDSWETALRWRVASTKETKSVWRTLRLRVRPTLLHSDRIRLETACGAQFSTTPPAAQHATDNSMVDLGAEFAHQTLFLTPAFSAADPGQFPEDEICVFVLITPHWKRESEEQSERSSCPDLLAPRNVLNRHAARPTRDPSRAAVEPSELQLFTDDSLLESSADLGTDEVFVTPENDLLSGEPSPAAKAEVAELFLIKGTEQRKR